MGACATTAIWSAMSRVVRADGGRAPTPYAVTQAATRHYLRDRALPAVSGLELAQLTAAVHEFGYAPYVLKPANEYATFLLSLKSYLLSGIPAVLVIEDAKGEYHAVAASGYRLGDDEEPADDIRVSFPDQGGELRSRGINRLYVHDDLHGFRCPTTRRLRRYVRRLILPSRTTYRSRGPTGTERHGRT